MKKVIKCGYLFSTDEKRFVAEQSVFIDGNKIEKITATTPETPEGYDVVDLSGKYVLPGLIDCHVHLHGNGEMSMAQEFLSLTEADVAYRAMLNARDDLMAGFTTVRNVGSPYFVDAALKRAIESGRICGPRIIASGPYLGTTGGHADSHLNPYIDTRSASSGVLIDSPEEGVKAVRRNIKYGADVIKIMATGGVTSMGDDAGACEFSMEEMLAIVGEAKAKGKTTAAHTHATAGINAALKAGITSIEHGTMMDEEGHRLLIETGAYLVPTMIAGYTISQKGAEGGIPKVILEKNDLVVSRHFEVVARCYREGANIAFGSDVAIPFNKHGKQALEFRLMVEHCGFSHADAILTATRNAARLIRMEGKVGDVVPGAFADVVATDRNPLEDITALGEITFVMKNGTVYKKPFDNFS